MGLDLPLFESIVRRAHRFSDGRPRSDEPLHPFELRNIHPELAAVSRALFDDGHYAQATFEAYKFLDKKVQSLAGSSETGKKLMMAAFNEASSAIKLTPLATTSHRDEQEGYKFLFAGSILAVRNPRAHELLVKDSPDVCLDHLCLASLLLRRLHDAGYK